MSTNGEKETHNNMPRSTPQPGWHPARESKPTKGLRVILKIAILGDEGDEDHVIG